MKYKYRCDICPKWHIIKTHRYVTLTLFFIVFCREFRYSQVHRQPDRSMTNMSQHKIQKDVSELKSGGRHRDITQESWIPRTYE